MGFMPTECVVSAADRAVLEQWLRSPTVPQEWGLRAKILLASAAGEGVRAMARRLEVSPTTVCLWRERYRKEGLAGLRTQPRPGRPRRISQAKERSVVEATLRPPKVATHWSARRLAKQVGLSSATVHRIWQKYGLQPHRVKRFKFSTDPDFDSKLADVIGLYLDPPERALVLCVDEKSQIQALDRTAPLLPLRPGYPERQTHDYRRYGTTTLFAAFNILTGKVIGTCQGRHRGREFVRFLRHLEQAVPPDLEVHLIVDNYSTHKGAAVQRWLKPKARRRFHFHFTPTSSSWLNQVERWFALITDRMIRLGTFHSVAELEHAIYQWLANWNQEPQPFVWTATADVILDKVRRCKELTGTAH